MRLARWSAPWLALALACGDDAAGSAGAADGGMSHEVARAGQGGGSTDAGDGDQRQCPAPDGTYEALYTPLSGNCGPLSAPARVAFEATPGVSTNIQNFAAASVTTEIVMQECALRVTQEVEDAATGAVVLRIAAELTIDGDGAISGMATITRFEGGAVECMGTYSAELRRASMAIGGAASGNAGSGSDAGSDLDPGLPPSVEMTVEYDCAQTVMCRVQRGEPLAPDPIASCIQATTDYLRSDPDRLSEYLEVFGACQQFVVCDYVSCTQTARAP